MLSVPNPTPIPTPFRRPLDPEELAKYRSLDLEAVRKRSRIRFWRMLEYFLFLIYPTVSSSVLRYFVCRTISGVPYLLADMSQARCDSKPVSNARASYHAAILAIIIQFHHTQMRFASSMRDIISPCCLKNIMSRQRLIDFQFLFPIILCRVTIPTIHICVIAALRRGLLHWLLVVVCARRGDRLPARHSGHVLLPHLGAPRPPAHAVGTLCRRGSNTAIGGFGQMATSIHMFAPPPCLRMKFVA
jgi:hypothetical protein